LRADLGGVTFGEIVYLFEKEVDGNVEAVGSAWGLLAVIQAGRRTDVHLIPCNVLAGRNG
jgi:hypothetical protein